MTSNEQNDNKEISLEYTKSPCGRSDTQEPTEESSFPLRTAPASIR